MDQFCHKLEATRIKYNIKLQEEISQFHWTTKSRYVEKDDLEFLEDETLDEINDYNIINSLDILFGSFIKIFDDYYCDKEDSSASTILEISAFIDVFETQFQDRFQNKLHDITHPRLYVVVYEYFNELLDTFKAARKEFFKNTKPCDFCSEFINKENIITLSCGHNAHLLCGIELYTKKNSFCEKCNKVIKLF